MGCRVETSMSGLSIIAGLVAAEATHQVANRLDDTEEEIQQHLTGEVTEDDIRKAVEIASEDRGQLERIANGLSEAIMSSNENTEEVEKAQAELQRLKNAPEKFTRNKVTA